jgi:hypothetical protein
MTIQKLPNGNLLVPMRAEGKGTIGDGIAEIGPDHPDYQKWVTWMKQQAKPGRAARTKESN